MKGFKIAVVLLLLVGAVGGVLIFASGRDVCAQDGTSCSCPQLTCAQGIEAGCRARCPASQQARCDCANCLQNGLPSGSNRCYCQP
jgi:hypothetical protein